MIINSLYQFGEQILMLIMQPENIIILLSSVIMGIIFGALPGLTPSLGIALLTTLSYGMNQQLALLALIGVYVGAVYGGSYAAILINIPGTSAAAATALDGYPLAQKGEAGKALGLTASASAIGTIIGMLFVITLSPIITGLALQFTSFEFFLLALFGILISGTLTSKDLVYKGWIAGFIGLFMAMVGRDHIQSFPRYTLGMADLHSGLEIVPVLIGAFGIPQIIKVLSENLKAGRIKKVKRILPEFKSLYINIPNIIRSSLIGVGIGAIPGIGEDIAGWVSYGAAKKASKHPETFGKGELSALVSTETANNACIGGAMIPLLTLGIPGSPPAAMLLGALMIHGISPGPMLFIDRPDFLFQITAILFLSSIVLWICGILLAGQVVKVLKIPPTLFMPVIAILCVIGSYSLGLRTFNLGLMLIVGIICYILTQMSYPIAPLVIGVILGPMADSNLRRALMVSKGSFLPVIQRPVSLILFLIIIFTLINQTDFFKRLIIRIKFNIT